MQAKTVDLMCADLPEWPSVVEQRPHSSGTLAADVRA